MTQAKIGDKVRVHYSGFLEKGTIIESTFKREPLEFTLGRGAVIPGLENAVIGMKEGDTKIVSIPPEEAHGNYREDLVVEMERSQIPSHIDPQIGMTFKASLPDGLLTNFIIKDISENTIILDGNHPLAGKDLHFEIELLEVI